MLGPADPTVRVWGFGDLGVLIGNPQCLESILQERVLPLLNWNLDWYHWSFWWMSWRLEARMAPHWDSMPLKHSINAEHPQTAPLRARLQQALPCSCDCQNVSLWHVLKFKKEDTQWKKTCKSTVVQWNKKWTYKKIYLFRNVAPLRTSTSSLVDGGGSKFDILGFSFGPESGMSWWTAEH